MSVQMEVNATKVQDPSEGRSFMVTPPIGSGEFWLARVWVTQRQALICFPKFGTIGIGFLNEDDWNTNLPFTCKAAEILNHIRHNKGETISDETCLEAIELLRAFAAKRTGRQARR